MQGIKPVSMWWKRLSHSAQLAIMLLLALSLFCLLVHAMMDKLDLSNWVLNMGSELFGALITFLLIEQFVGRDEKERETKSSLIHRMTSTNEFEAQRAVKDLRVHHWLCDGTLQGIDLSGANLTGAWLDNADLKSACLLSVNLMDASLLYVDLSDAIYNMNTTLPDGTRWKPGTDMGRFTDPNHPQFWQPIWSNQGATKTIIGAMC